MTTHTNELSNLLERKVTACQDFLSATMLLKAALETEEMTDLDCLIGKRQKLIRIMDDMDRRIEHHRDRIPPDQSRQLGMVSEKLKRLLKQMISVNQDCDALAVGRCNGLREEIMDIRRMGTGIHVYGHANEKTQKFLNIRT
jgi:hypothetical protein